jgi:hypothetical protein
MRRKNWVGLNHGGQYFAMESEPGFTKSIKKTIRKNNN